MLRSSHENLLQQIGISFIKASTYDPTTIYLGDNTIDRDEFKRLKKEGLLELSFENRQEKRYILSDKARKLIHLA